MMNPEDLAGMPPVLRELLEAELRAGNQVVEVGHAFPAPPVGAWFLLAGPLRSRPRESGGGITYYYRHCSHYSGEITDERQRFFFLLEPPGAPEPTATPTPAPPAPAPLSPPPAPATLAITLDNWRDAGSPAWREVESLAAQHTRTARQELRRILKRPGSHESKMAILICAPRLVSGKRRLQVLCEALRESVIYGGLTQALDLAAEFHPPEVVTELWRGLEHREGEVAVHFAALLAYIHGLAKEPFDWDLRPFFLRFRTEDPAERARQIAELRRRIAQKNRKESEPGVQS
jgi:hypothetical protein